MTLDKIEAHLAVNPIAGFTYERAENGRLRLTNARRVVFFDPESGANGYLAVFNAEGWRQHGAFVSSLGEFEATLRQVCADCDTA